ncbi:metallophosphoesterase [Ideonella sp. A 288]|uniref:metallophosphoesterase n=1 Tax=Ideonella sp. A 288 TaxID=1962181 RepID=UPI001185651E|nr:metallophosphoesterase [Ideonella sp. A 288]
MRLQLLSDLHLETESFEPRPSPDAELLVLGGDIDATWAQLDRFAGWPVPVLMVAGNHEFDGRDLGDAWAGLRERCDSLGIRLLERERWVVTSAAGRRVRFVGTVRWSDFDGLGSAQRDRAMRASAYFLRLMAATRQGVPIDAEVMRNESLACRRWLEDELHEPPQGRWDDTVVITHFAPSLRCADPRYGRQPGTASFCNADEDLLPLADLWLHGHLHCRHDFTVHRPGRRPMRVVCQARGLADKGEADGFDEFKPIDVGATDEVRQGLLPGPCHTVPGDPAHPMESMP